MAIVNNTSTSTSTSTSAVNNTNNNTKNMSGRKALIQSLIASGNFHKEVKVLSHVEVTRTPRTKNTKAKVKRTPIYKNETRTVLNTGALVRAVEAYCRVPGKSTKSIKSTPKTMTKSTKSTKSYSVEDILKGRLEKVEAEKQRREAQSHAAAMAHRKGEIARLDEQLAIARAQSTRKITINPMTKTIKVGAPSAGAIRNKARVERGVAQAQRMVKLSAKLRAERIVAKHTRTPMSEITSVTNVASFGQNVGVVTSMYSYPKITMSMSQESILTLIHNQAMDDLASIHNISEPTPEQYEDAVLDCYRTVIETNNLSLTVSLEDDIFAMAANYQPAQEVETTARGGDNLDKNSVVESESIPVVNTIISDTMNNFKATYNADYSEVQPLVNFGRIADAVVNFNGVGQSMAEIFANLVYKMEKAYHIKSDSAERRAEREARVARINARTQASRQAFLDKFGTKLGHVAPATIQYTNLRNFSKLHPVVRTNLESLFTLKEVPATEGGETRYFGREYDPKATTFKVDDKVRTNGLPLFVSILAKATYNLTAEERAEVLGVLFNDIAQVEGTVISRDKISIDLAKATVTTPSRELVANKASVLGKLNIATDEFLIVDGHHSIFLFAIQALGGTVKQLETSINLAVKLFQPEHNYGHKPDSDDISNFVRNNLVYTNQLVVANNSFPSYQLVGGKQDPRLLDFVLRQGVLAASDKTNVKFITINTGAEATGLGWNRELNILMTCNDVDKSSKITNRGAANSYDCADLPNRVASKFGFLLSNGEVARTKGALKKTAYTNSILLTAGSGNGTINPDSYFEYSVDKKEKQPLHFSLFGHKALNNDKFQKAFIQGLLAKIDSLKGQTFKAGETMIEVEVQGAPYEVISNSEEVATVEVIGGSIKRNAVDNNEIEVIIDVRMLGKSQFVKTRRFATKFTTTPYNVKGLSRPWEIILNNECTKGQGALLEMFANETGDRFVNNSNGEFVTPEGDVINLLAENNAFQTWKETSAVKETISVEMAKSVFNNIARFAEGELRVVSETETTVVVEEDITVIYGELVYDVEISTPLESVSSSNLTLESAAAIYLQSRRLGEMLLNEAANKADKFVALANNFAGSDVKSMEVIDLDTDEGFNTFVEKAGDVSGLTHRDIVKKLVKAFSKGVTFYAGKEEFNCNFLVINSFGQFSSLNGSGARETAQIMNFLIDVLSNGASNAKANITGAKRAFAKVLNTAVDSKKVLKKPTRTGKLVYGKVRTGFHPILNSVDGIPTVVMNVNCPIVKLLGLKVDNNTTVNFNQFVGFARTPMPFLGGARVVLTDDASICDVAHVLVDPYVWHCLNEGDTDGDGIAVMNLGGKINFTKDEVIALNKSLMGMGGYAHLYGTNVPFADFMSIKDKHGKKNPAGKVNMISNAIKNPDCPRETKIALTPEVMGDFAARVANHYKSAVGTSYGICSKLVFQAADLAAAGESQELTYLIEATLIAWRLLYEGLGLSGYSARAYKVFDVINKASVDTEALQLYCSETGCDVVFNHNRSDCRYGADVLAEMFGDLSVARNVFEYIISSRTVTRVYTKLEGFGKDPSSGWWDAAIPAAIKYGTLRRISQGDDRVADELGLREEAEQEAAGEFVGKPLTRWLTETDEVSFTNETLGAVATKVAQFHALLCETKAELLDQENS